MDNIGEYKLEYLDLQNTKFDKYVLIEEQYDGKYEYRLKYSIDIKYHNVKTGNISFDNMINTTPLHDEGSYGVTLNERPDVISSFITKEDTETEDGVDKAIAEFVEVASTSQLLNLTDDVFGKKIPQIVFDKAAIGTMTLKKKKVKDIDYDYRKISLNKIIVKYDDGTTYTVELPNKVTNKDFYNVTGYTQPFLYREIESWLQDDYDGTIKLLNELFGVDLETLKGATIK